MEEAAATSRQLSALSEENARLIGHSNHKQKIQHHVKIKHENDVLKQVGSRLRPRLLRAACAGLCERKPRPRGLVARRREE